MSKVERTDKPEGTLRRGWTTGACATAATKAALTALLTGAFPDPVTITLPKGETPAFPLARETLDTDFAEAGIVKDAGDDPDVTHGATIISRVTRNDAGSGIRFLAGNGVGTVTKTGLPIGIGEAAINPVPRSMIEGVVNELTNMHDVPPDFDITISVPDGERIAEHTWNPRLGILGGISILGTTGIVHPFSCSAWIHSIHRGIDVSRAAGETHVLGATGSTSETAACQLYEFHQHAMLDMGDFVGGLLKYLRKNPIPRITLAGGFGKFIKLANGALDLHSGRSQIDFDWLAEEIEKLHLNQSLKPLNQNIKSQIQNANTALEVLELTHDLKLEVPLHIAQKAQKTALETLRGALVEVEILVYARDGTLLARTDWMGPNG